MIYEKNFTPVIKVLRCIETQIRGLFSEKPIAKFTKPQASFRYSSRMAVRPFLVLLLCFPLLVAGCTVPVASTGKLPFQGRLQLALDEDWERTAQVDGGRVQMWTREGVAIDRLLVYAGIGDGESIDPDILSANPGSARLKRFRFHNRMQAQEITSLFGAMLSHDGSRFDLRELQPHPFGAAQGFRFTFALVRRSDGARLSGLAYGAVDKGELFAIVYLAPRLTFFPRHQARVDQMAKGAKLK